jgi:hypothetical protein
LWGLWVGSSLKSKVKTFAAVISLALAIGIPIWNYTSNLHSDRSYRYAVLQELQDGRDSLAYTLACRNRNWRRPANFTLLHAEKIPKLFDDNLSLRKDVSDLYQAMSSGMKQTEELRNLLAQENADPKSIQNLEAAIEKTVKLADAVGPRIGQSIGQSWNIPLPNMSVEQLTDYYERNIRYPVATDDMVQFGKQKR